MSRNSRWYVLPLVVLGVLVLLVVPCMAHEDHDEAEHEHKDGPEKIEAIKERAAKLAKRAPGAVEILKNSALGALRFDPAMGETGKIRFTLSDAGIARVRVRHASPSGAPAIIQTIVDWKEFPAGENAVAWDGKDSDGNIVDLKKCSFEITADKLREPLQEGESAEPKKPFYFHPHFKHSASVCRDLVMEMESPADGSTVSGICSVKITVDESKAGYQNIGHGLRFYVDRKLKKEKDCDTATVTLKWDTTKVANGRHLITVNVCDHHDHVGIKTVEVNVHN